MSERAGFCKARGISSPASTKAADLQNRSALRSPTGMVRSMNRRAGALRQPARCRRHPRDMVSAYRQSAVPIKPQSRRPESGVCAKSR
jgi:hypothetical protein